MLLDLYGEHPIVLSFQSDPSDGLRRLSDLVSDRDLYRSRAFKDGLSLLDVNRQLAFVTSGPSMHRFHCWTMNRWGRDFSDNELELARHIQPMPQLLDAAYATNGREVSEKIGQDAFSLTAREQEIFDLLGKGLTAVAIGHLLGISPPTVSKYLEHSYGKLGCTNRIDALRILGTRD